MRKAYLGFCGTLQTRLRCLLIVLMAVLTVDVLVGVFFRYVVRDALVWTEEVARDLMIWMGFLGTAVALREGNHIALTSFIDLLPSNIRLAMVRVVQTLCCFFLVSVVGAGVLLLLRIRSQTTPVLGISMMWPYLAIPAGCLLTAVEMVAQMLQNPPGQPADLDHAAVPGSGG